MCSYLKLQSGVWKGVPGSPHVWNAALPSTTCESDTSDTLSISTCRYQVNVLTSSWHVTCPLKSQDLSSPSLSVNCPSCQLAGTALVLHCLLSAAISFQFSLRGSETTAMCFCILRCQSKMKHCRQEKKVAEKSCCYGEEENLIFTLW